MITNKDIIIVGQQPWDEGLGSNCKDIALEFSRGNRVLYVNAPLDRITAIRFKNEEKVKKRLNIIKGKERGLLKLQENLWNLYPDCLIQSINWIRNTLIHTYFNKRNNWKFAASIRKAAEELGFKDYIIFNDGDIFRSFYLTELLGPQTSIYYSRDNLLATEYYKFHGARLEPQLIAKSDLCVANSTYLADYCQKYNPKSYYVGQGCDFTIDAGADKEDSQADIKSIKSPVIGYAGALLTTRLDIEILVNIAKRCPEWQIVLIGPEDEGFKASALHNMSNVHFLGAKKPKELPTYINRFDVCINPQSLNQLTIGNYPRKIDEYLFLGKPVVATKTEAMRAFEDYVLLAENKTDYPFLIERALALDTDDERISRRSFAAGHTWENSVNEIYRSIEKTKPALAELI